MDGADRYWCHMCSQMVNPIMEVIEMKCPICQNGFIEEMGNGSTGEENHDSETDFGSSDRALGLWAPILLGMSNPHRPRRSRRPAEGGENDNAEGGDTRSVETELNRELQSLIRRRRRSSATILQMLQQMRAGSTDTESENSEGGGDRDRESEGVILINAFNQAIIVQGLFDRNQSQPQNQNENHPPIGSRSDYFVGPDLDLLLQHLADTDTNRYGTPPAKKETIEAMATVKIDQVVQCSVCLDDFELESEAKEMPCKHKFHKGCITPWLELHSSCPVCRYQLSSDESKLNSNEPNSSSDNVNGENENENENGNGNGNGNESGFSIPWPLNSLFSSSTGSSQTGGNGNNSSSTS